MLAEYTNMYRWKKRIAHGEGRKGDLLQIAFQFGNQNTKGAMQLATGGVNETLCKKGTKTIMVIEVAQAMPYQQGTSLTFNDLQLGANSSSA